LYGFDLASLEFCQHNNHQSRSDICCDQPPSLDYCQDSDHQSSSDVCCDQPPSLDYHQDSDHQSRSDICCDQPPSLDYCQDSDHQSSSDVCCDQPPYLDYHQDSDYQTNFNLCYDQSLGCTTHEFNQPGSHLEHHQISFDSQCHQMDSILCYPQSDFDQYHFSSSLLSNQGQLVNMFNPHIYSEQQQPPLDHFSLLKLQSSLLNDMTSFKNWFVLLNDSVSKIQFCIYGTNIAASPMITFIIEIYATHEW